MNTTDVVFSLSPSGVEKALAIARKAAALLKEGNVSILVSAPEGRQPSFVAAVKSRARQSVYAGMVSFPVSAAVGVKVLGEVNADWADVRDLLWDENIPAEYVAEFPSATGPWAEV